MQMTTPLSPRSTFRAPLASSSSLPSAITFVETFKARIGGDALEQRLTGLESFSWPDFDHLPEDKKFELATIAAANADAGSVLDDGDMAFSVATAVTLLDMVDVGRLPPSVLSTSSFAGVVHSLDAVGFTMDNMPTIVDRVADSQAGITTLGLLNAFELKGASFTERAAGLRRLREVDRRYDGAYEFSGPQGHLTAALSQTSMLGRPAAQSPTGLESAIHAIGTVSNRMRALVDLTKDIKGTGNEAELAGINAELKLLQAEMDILLGLIDQLTGLFEKVGQAFSR